MKSYIQAMRRYAAFSGRTSRTNYWLFILGVAILAFVGVLIDYSQGYLSFGQGYIGPFALVVLGLHFLPFVAASVRRIHDSDQSGWLYWLIYIPLLGWIPFLGLMVARGSDGSNRYGEPKLIVRSARPMEFGSYEQVPLNFEGVQNKPINGWATTATVPNAAFRPVAAAPAGETSLIEQLERLAVLRASGGLSDEEFETLKSQLLSKATR